jgi:S-adenosylmethionine:tRNA ribosyltransferase-isomerase
MHVNDFNYELPPELIAQFPADKREESRLMVIHRKSGLIEHKHFYNILDYLKSGDCLVLNDSKVLPARLKGRKEGGAKIEFLLLKRRCKDVWETMVRPGRKAKVGEIVHFSESPFLSAKIIDYGEEGTRIVEFEYEGDLGTTLDSVGQVPLPPYIKRENVNTDRSRYQTVYCKEQGSVAAPTAGLHFTEEVLGKIKKKGISVAYLTLHVGIGTFRPVKCEDIEEHKMHFEEYRISQDAASAINHAKASGGRIVSVGTTTTRTLESAADENGTVREGSGKTDIFIHPGFSFTAVDCQLTNFHLPKSTLLMLVSAFYDREEILKAYDLAVRDGYRFFSYGDAMLII